MQNDAPPSAADIFSFGATLFELAYGYCLPREAEARRRVLKEASPSYSRNKTLEKVIQKGGGGGVKRKGEGSFFKSE